MMKIVVSQPMYVPWPGLFNQIKLADMFVHYDDVQLPQGRSFMSRVQIKTPKEVQWLTVPLKRATRGLINEVEIDYTKSWENKHIYLIRESLRQTPYLDNVLDIMNSAYRQKFQYLADLNIFLLERISNYLGINTLFKRSSSMNINGCSSHRLINIVQKLEGKIYLTGHGAKNYLDHEMFEQENIQVQYMHYQIKKYEQSDENFTPYVTILDLIARKGAAALNYLESTTISWKEFTTNE